MIKIKSWVFVFFIIFSILFVGAVSLDVGIPSSGSVFNYTNVSYNLNSSETSDFYILKNRLKSNSANKLCDNIVFCNVSNVNAREGNNNVTIKVVSLDGDIISKNIDFLVDTIPPRGISSVPRNGEDINNRVFSVKYNENNLKRIILYYGNTSLINNLTSQNCSSGNKQVCNFYTNVSNFSGQTIKYWFEILDIANNLANSSVKLVDVDTDKPNVLSKSYSIEGNRVSFNFQIEEENFDKIILRDNSDRIPKWIRLCSRLSLGSCIKTKNFKDGIHNIDIKVYDHAENYADIYINEIITIS